MGVSKENRNVTIPKGVIPQKGKLLHLDGEIPHLLQGIPLQEEQDLADTVVVETVDTEETVVDQDTEETVVDQDTLVVVVAVDHTDPSLKDFHKALYQLRSRLPCLTFSTELRRNWKIGSDKWIPTSFYRRQYLLTKSPRS